MSDRPLTQQRLASDLAGLVDSLDIRAVIPFLSAFWKTMAREWRGIDVLRYAVRSTTYDATWQDDFTLLFSIIHVIIDSSPIG